ncbi:hatching enzyme 1.2-like [Paramacrobiotus metropolitanus]|uniref:hatching enzyme 1.2-like n=1 Tax=Paramacrobiotus metropolitanus TaxID=2943436 RepID=UPI002445BD3C|nr:hatching enzyme 1.2-like [Paramacrobiotus metropolitanus]
MLHFGLGCGIALLVLLCGSSTARTLPDNWRQYVDADAMADSNDQSRYSNDYWEGDIAGIDFEELKGNSAANAVDNDALLWPNNTVPYEFTTQTSATFSSSEKKMIKEAMDIIMHFTGNCVKFVPRTYQLDYVKFQKSFQCSSNIGRLGQKQLIQLTPSCTAHYGCIQHELMHTLGFYHEQSRLDRDDHVIINWDNIAAEDKAQFEKRKGVTYDLPYDYQSIMHYELKAFAKDPNFPTIIPLVKGMKMGQNENLSPLDLARIYNGNIRVVIYEILPVKRTFGVTFAVYLC